MLTSGVIVGYIHSEPAQFLKYGSHTGNESHHRHHLEESEGGGVRGQLGGRE